MKPERWQQIERLYHAALEREAGERSAFLAAACGGDEALRREVESLLRFHERADQFIEAPALEVAAQALAESEGPTLVMEGEKTTAQRPPAGLVSSGWWC